MKLQDLFKMIKKENEFKEFMGDNRRRVVKLNQGLGDQEFKTFREFKKAFNEVFVEQIENDTEIFNDNGYICFTIKSQHKAWSKEKGACSWTEEETYSIYLETVQE